MYCQPLPRLVQVVLKIDRHPSNMATSRLPSMTLPRGRDGYHMQGAWKDTLRIISTQYVFER